MKNSYKPSKPPKTLIQYNFLVPPIEEEGLILWRKVNPQSSPLPFSSISSTCSFLFSQAFPSLLLQTRKHSLSENMNPIHPLICPYCLLLLEIINITLMLFFFCCNWSYTFWYGFKESHGCFLMLGLVVMALQWVLQSDYS